MGNRDGLDGIIKFIDMAPEGELRATGRLPDGGPVRGRKAVKNWWRQLLEEVDFRFEAEEYIDAGDAVVIIAQQLARGHASGAEVANRIIAVCGFRGGKVTSVDAYRTKAKALEAVSLRE
jgi:ketosteroid isomerase-like protein